MFEPCSAHTAKTGLRTVAALMYAATIAGAPDVTPAGPDVTSARLPAKAVAAGKALKASDAPTGTRPTAGQGSGRQLVYVRAQDASGTWGLMPGVCLTIR